MGGGTQESRYGRSRRPIRAVCRKRRARFGGDSALFGGLDSCDLSRMTTLAGWRRSTFSYQPFGGSDSATTTTSASASADADAVAGTEIMSTPYRQVDLNILGGGLVS